MHLKRNLHDYFQATSFHTMSSFNLRDIAHLPRQRLSCHSVRAPPYFASKFPTNFTFQLLQQRCYKTQDIRNAEDKFVYANCVTHCS